MAHIVKRGEKHYEVVIELRRDPKTGKRKRKYKNVRGTKEKAEKVLAEMLKQGENYNTGNIKLSKYLKDWFNNYKSNISHKTEIDYKSIINKHLIPALGRIK